MNTRIKSWHGSTIVEGHQKPIPLNPDKTVDYQAMVKRIQEAYGVKEDTKRNLCEIF